MFKIASVVLLSALASGSSVRTGHVPVINDDYARARAEALHRHVPVFVEVWAPW